MYIIIISYRKQITFHIQYTNTTTRQKLPGGKYIYSQPRIYSIVYTEVFENYYITILLVQLAASVAELYMKIVFGNKATNIVPISSNVSVRIVCMCMETSIISYKMDDKAMMIGWIRTYCDVYNLSFLKLYKR